MRDDYIQLGKERIGAFVQVAVDNLEPVEQKIREVLLQAMIDEIPLEGDSAQANAVAKERHHEIVSFIRKNKER